jgi:hypothetical protein
LACFLVPTGLAVATTLLRKKFPQKYHASWLNALLWGGAVMLAVEHLAHGEVVPYPPFLTAGLPQVLPEMLTVGIPMALANVLIWSVMVTIDLKIGEKMRRALTRGMETRMGTKTGQVKA